jgi:C4-dicarboxylate transporter DctM subunit
VHGAIGWAFVLIPFALLLLGVPIYLLLLVTALLALLFSTGTAPSVIQTTIFGSLDSFPLIAIPFFILAGEIMGQGGIAKRIIAWVVSVVGGIRGSLAITTIASSEIFGAMSGSSVGCVAAVGRLLLPSLRERGYPDRFSVSLISASGAIAVIIPPSIPLIIYGVVAQQAVPVLFLAGIVPAILIGLIDVAYVLFYAHTKKIALTERARWSNIWKATKDASWALGTPVVIFGGIYGGIFTPTEAAGMAVVYAFFVSMFVYKDITWAKLWNIAISAAQLNGQILVIVTAAGVYSWFLTTSGLPQEMIAGIQSYHIGLVGTLLLFNLILLFVGSFLEPAPAILVLAPLFLPVVTALGVSPIHFGIIIAVNLSIGTYMPPFGLNLFAAHSLFRAPLGMLFRGVVPFLAINAIGLLIITYVPEISLWIPAHMHK